MQAPADLQVPAAPGNGGQVIIRPGTDAPQAVYRAFNEQRKELANQLENLESKRNDLANTLTDAETDKAARPGLEQRMGELDKRIADVDKQLAAADLAVARAAAVPGAVVVPPPKPRNGPPGGVYFLAAMFIAAVFFPLSMALARRIWRRSSDAPSSMPAELSERLNRVDQSLDSIAVEVERIGEGQRFVTRVMSESGRAIGAGPAQPVDAGARGAQAAAARDSNRT